MSAADEVDILRLGHLEYRVTDLARARAFYVDLLGFVETGRDRGRLYLRGLEEREHHSLVLRQAEAPGASHFAFRVAGEEHLDRLHRRCMQAGLPVRWVGAGVEDGQGRALRVQDPAGLPVEFYHHMDRVERHLQRFDLYRGPHIMRIDHVNVQVPDVRLAYDWYTGAWGFRCSEYTETEDQPPRLWAAWLHRKQTVHDIAVMTGTGPRLHHAGFWVPDALSVLRACDILAGAGRSEAIERGPGRHGLSNALFVYLRDGDGNRIELYTGDYQIADPDWQPIRWSLNDPRRATFWGHVPPRSWFEEASPVEAITDGTLIAPRPPLLADRPSFVT
ncbi:MAG: 3,4-dihydroxyphenylacetate 2,3-dioxygenase [Armatimonadota bacterium]|nr:3,4-dihydroxyphenylacetate 2,3-dioxygenase [Armatimonadota bacterium]MDR7452411.1 3,4-dihydroxyphenylacetate 2,3-dioxygenase [Armatimonadota bacterium]MDR7468098.1 3,4-dihydroxyphenylacetate 2,3-dioxygenase [Armatimonadota bacterium]MDR7494668.1 3,4-dihydroxyphenylacetate 2,3-dioxygenase [Armatimonadota bacterium]MDR7500199.1 3,4-dihydroxyphenylacetate 2,3-dioxygenase [Armatimonadota bacterium]